MVDGKLLFDSADWEPFQIKDVSKRGNGCCVTPVFEVLHSFLHPILGSLYISIDLCFEYNR